MYNRIFYLLSSRGTRNPPYKHDQLCDGRVTLVNSYTEQDRPLVTEALHAFYARDDERGASD